MPNEEWGTRAPVTPQTGKRFYDLNKDPIISPYSVRKCRGMITPKSRMIAADREDGSVQPNPRKATLMNEESLVD